MNSSCWVDLFIVSEVLRAISTSSWVLGIHLDNIRERLGRYHVKGHIIHVTGGMLHDGNLAATTYDGIVQSEIYALQDRPNSGIVLSHIFCPPIGNRGPFFPTL